MARSSLRVTLVAGVSVLALAACAPPSKSSDGGGGSKAARTSAAWTRW
jgi:hypothetical protein